MSEKARGEFTSLYDFTERVDMRQVTAGPLRP